MVERGPLIDDKGEVREITEEDLKHFKRFDGLPAEMQAKLRRVRVGRPD